MKNVLVRPLLSGISAFVMLAVCHAQEPVKVFVEEVRIPVTAKDSTGRFDPTVDVNDLLLLFARKGIKPALARRSDEFRVVAEETGGNLWLPGSAEEMVREAGEVARDVDSQYVLSYKPIKPLNKALPNEYRRVEVISRRVGLTVSARRGYVVNPADPSTKPNSPIPHASTLAQALRF